MIIFYNDKIIYIDICTSNKLRYVSQQYLITLAKINGFYKLNMN